MEQQMDQEELLEGEREVSFCLSNIPSSTKDELNQVIKANKNRYTICKIVCLIFLLGFIGAGIGVGTTINSSIGWAIGSFGSFAVVFVFAFWSNSIKKKVKVATVPLAVKALYGSDAKFEADKGFNEDFMHELNLFNFGNVYDSTQRIEANEKGVNFMVANVHSGLRTSSGRTGSSEYTYFRGIVAIYNFNKSFNGELEIREKEIGVTSSFRFPKSSKVEFEDIEFNKGFDVYSSDKELAFYVVTPSLLLALKQIKAKIPGSLIFYVESDRLVIAVNGANNDFNFTSKYNTADKMLTKIIEEIMPYKWIINVLHLDDPKSMESLKRLKKNDKDTSLEAEEDEIDSLLKKEGLEEKK